MKNNNKKSPLLVDKEEEIIDAPPYTEEQEGYLSNLKKRLIHAKDTRDAPHEEFDGLSFIQYWQKNEEIANTYIKPRKNQGDVLFQSGTLRVKLFAFISSIISLNLFPDILAYDKNDNVASSLGNAMEDIIDKTYELENDEEKQFIRIYELLKQGTTFHEELWDVKSYKAKELTKQFDGTFAFKGWKEKKKETDGKAIKNILCSKDVYLGNIKKYYIDDQPYLFTVENKTYEEVEKMFGDWEMFKYVPKKKTPVLAELGDKEYKYHWALHNHPQGQVEIIRYQSLSDNEYQILINGIPMLPIGYPLPWGNRYNITQQNFEPIRKDFAYGKSFIFKNKNVVELLDEMLRMATLKTYKSFMPPYLNTSEMVVNKSVLMPGKITMGIPPGSLKPVSQEETRGVTQGEFNMIEYIKRYVDENTASQTFTGSKEKGTVTATQIIELQRQARIMLGVVILSVSLMEKKLAKLRLYTILENWFDPTGTEVDEARNILKNRYRIVSRQRGIDGEGPGLRYIVPTEEKITTDRVFEEEETLKKTTGRPTRIIFIKPKEIKQAEYVWVITINPREKKSSELNKLMFQQKIQGAYALGLQPDPNYVKEQYAEVWGDDPSKLFGTGEQQQPMPPAEGGQPAGAEGAPQNIGGPVVKKPEIGVDQATDKIAQPRL